MTTKKRGSIAIGPLSNKNTGAKHYVEQDHDFAQPTRVTNATVSSTDPLCLEKLWENSAQRPGALDFMKFKSRGFGC